MDLDFHCSWFICIYLGVTMNNGRKKRMSKPQKIHEFDGWLLMDDGELYVVPHADREDHFDAALSELARLARELEQARDKLKRREAFWKEAREIEANTKIKDLRAEGDRLRERVEHLERELEHTKEVLEERERFLADANKDAMILSHQLREKDYAQYQTTRQILDLRERVGEFKKLTTVKLGLQALAAAERRRAREMRDQAATKAYTEILARGHESMADEVCSLLQRLPLPGKEPDDEA
jgi:chromosome segregation ATPase